MKLSSAMILCLLWPTIIMAQRGADYKHNSATPQNFMSDYPGFFDTNIPPKRGITLDLPSGTLDFGVNESLSLGINGFSVIATAVNVQLPSLIGKVRYRLYASPNFSTSITLYPGFLSSEIDYRNGSNSEGISGKNLSLFQIATLNASWYLSDSDLTLSVIEITLSTSDKFKDSSLNSSKLLSLGLAAFSYHIYMSDFFGPQITVGSTLWSTQQEKNNSTTTTLNANIDETGLFARVCLDFRIFEKVIISPMIYFVQGLPDLAPRGYVPFGTIAFKW